RRIDHALTRHDRAQRGHDFGAARQHRGIGFRHHDGHGRSSTLADLSICHSKSTTFVPIWVGHWKVGIASKLLSGASRRSKNLSSFLRLPASNGPCHKLLHTLRDETKSTP